MVAAIINYGNSEAVNDFDAGDLAEYLIEVIDELHIKSKDVILDTYNNLMLCPHCQEIIGITSDWTPNYCKECGESLTGGNQYQ